MTSFISNPVLTSILTVFGKISGVFQKKKKQQNRSFLWHKQGYLGTVPYWDFQSCIVAKKHLWKQQYFREP